MRKWVEAQSRVMERAISPLWSIAVAITTLIGPAIGAGVFWFWGYRARRQRRRNPLSRHLLRSPGHSLLERVDELRWDLAGYLAVSMLPVPFAAMIYLATWVSEGHHPSVFILALSIVFAVGFQLWSVRKVWRVLIEIRPLRLGYEAELAVGQELNDLARLGYRVFHDLSVDEREFNVDHVLVGPAGVFAVETKGRSKPTTSADGRDAWEVQYDGEVLEFPGWKEKKPLAQATAIGNWLRDWLSSAVGDRVAVQPLLTLPGWYVKRTTGRGIPVLSGGQIASYFGGLKRDPAMTPEMIQRIAHQLDQRCRDVEPRAYAQARTQPEKRL